MVVLWCLSQAKSDTNRATPVTTSADISELSHTGTPSSSEFVAGQAQLLPQCHGQIVERRAFSPRTGCDHDVRPRGAADTPGDYAKAPSHAIAIGRLPPLFLAHRKSPSRFPGHVRERSHNEKGPGFHRPLRISKIERCSLRKRRRILHLFLPKPPSGACAPADGVTSGPCGPPALPCAS